MHPSGSVVREHQSVATESNWDKRSVLFWTGNRIKKNKAPKYFENNIFLGVISFDEALYVPNCLKKDCQKVASLLRFACGAHLDNVLSGPESACL